MRNRAFEESSHEAAIRERELREVQLELEQCRMDRDEWEREAMEDRVALDEARTSLENLRRDLEIEREARVSEHEELELEREKTSNLQSVLQDFQLGQLPSFDHEYTTKLYVAAIAKDHELRQAVRDLDAQLTQVTQSLAEYKHRAHTAEVRTSWYSNVIPRLMVCTLYYRCNLRKTLQTPAEPQNWKRMSKRRTC